MKRQKSLILYLVITFLIFFYALFYIFIKSVKDNELKFLESMLKKEAVTAFEILAATRQWVSSHSGVYVTKENVSINELNNSLNINLLKQVTPDSVTKQIKSASQHTYSLVSNQPINPNHRPNKFERRALDYLEHNRHERFVFEREKDFSEFHFLGVLIANESCLQCHPSNKVDDILGGISIQVPLDDYQQKYKSLLHDYHTIFTVSIIFIVVTILLIGYLVYQFFIKKSQLEENLKELKNLKKSNETLIRRYKYAVEGSQSGIWDWDLTTDKVQFDKNWKGMLGYEEHELENHFKEWDIRVHPDDKEKAIEDILNNQNKKTDFYINVHRLRHKDGHWVWILDRGRTYFDNEGKAVRMVGFHTDITEFKELEQKLYEKEQNLMTAQEIARMGHWRYDTIHDTFFVSDALYKLLEIPREKVFHSYSDFKEYIHKDDLEDYLHGHQKIFHDKTQSSLQYRMYKYNSEEILYVHEHISYMYNNQADVESYLGTIQDISAIKLAEQELRLFKKIIDNSPISIMITDANANMIYVNKHFLQLTGYANEEVIGRNPRILKSPETTKEEYSQMWATLLSKKTWGGILKNITKDGKVFWETALIIPILDDKEEIVNYLGVKREITKEVYLEKELKEKEEMMLMQSKHAAMGEMISMIAHQWRQPITTISMIANNILAEIELEIFNENNAKEFALELSNQTHYLSKTIDDFRNFFKQDKEKEEVSLKELFDDINTIISASLKNNNVLLQLEFDEDIHIRTYVRELLQVLINIIKNAKEAYEGQETVDKTIDISVKLKGSKVVFTVSDKAGGISPDNIDKIFEPYFTTKEEHNGTGLGLYMSKMIVQKHLKGTMSVQNTKEGASFKISLEQFLK